MKTLAFVLGLGSTTALLGLAVVACSGDDDPVAPADAGFERTLTEPDTYRPPIDNDTGPPPTVLTSGEGYSIVYSAPAPIGVDARPDAQATFNAKGELTGFYVSDDENLSRGIASNAGAGAGLLAAWGAWRDGPTTGKWYEARPDGRFTFGPGDDLHYAVGRKSTSAAWPQVTKAYTLAGSSAPTISGVAEPGALASAKATCDLGLARTCSSITIEGSAAGGTIAIAITDGKIVVGTAGTGRVDAPGLVATFAGAAAEEMILVYEAKLSGGAQADKTLRGAAVLKAAP